MKKKIKFTESKKFYDVIKRRKQCREYFMLWLRWMKEMGFINIDDDTDLKSLSYIQFNFKPHGRKGDVRKGDIYFCLAMLYIGVEKADGFEHGAASFFRYIASNEHSNLAMRPDTLKREIIRCLPCYCKEEKQGGNKSVEK